MRRKEVVDGTGYSAFPTEPSLSSLESGTFPHPSVAYAEGDGDDISRFLNKSNETKLLARKLAIETEKFKQLQKQSLESDPTTDQTALNNDISLSSQECVRLSNAINERLLDLSKDTQDTLEKGKGLAAADTAHNNPSVQRMKGGVNAALHSKFADQMGEFQRDVCDLKHDYAEKDRSDSSQIETLDNMIELCNEIYASNPLLSDREGQDQWNRLDSQMQMFYPKEMPTSAQETQPLLQTREEPTFILVSPMPTSPPLQAGDLERQTGGQQQHFWNRRPFLFAFFVILGIIIIIVAYILIQTLLIWKKQGSLTK